MVEPGAPKRIQRKRMKGWIMPAGAIYVGRPTKWGNPISLVEAEASFPYEPHVAFTPENVRAFAVSEYTSLYLASDLPFDGDDVRRELRGHDLACWCPLDQRCHADVLLEIANRGAA